MASRWKTPPSGAALLSDVALLVAVEHVCDWIESHGIWTEGAFREACGAGESLALAALIVTHPELLRENYILERSTMHAVCCALKLLLASSPLLPPDVGRELSDEELLEIAKRSLSPTRARVLHRLLLAVAKVVSSPVTGMDCDSMGAVLAPVLVEASEADGPAAAAVGSIVANRNVAALIASVKSSFPPYARMSEPTVQAKASCLSLTEEEWFQLTSRFSMVVAISVGDHLISMKEANPNLYRVRTGRLALLDEAQQRVGVAAVGSVVGVFSLFDPASRSVLDVKCEVAGEVNVFRNEDLDRLRAANPQLLARLYGHLALEMTKWMLVNLHERDGKQKAGKNSLRSLSGSLPAAAAIGAASVNVVIRAKLNGIWGSLIVSPQSIAHHGSFLGMSRSVAFVAESLDHRVCDKTDKSFVLRPTAADAKLLKLSFSSAADAAKASEAVAAFFASSHSLDELRLSQSSVTDIVNFRFASVVTQDFHDYGANCLNCRKGERVVISERKDSWVVATTIDRKPNACGWVPLAILADTSIHGAESKVLGNIVLDAVEKGVFFLVIFFCFLINVSTW